MRMTIPIADKLFWAGGIEQPFSDITTNGLGTNVQEMPDFATHVRYEADLGHVQVSGIAAVDRLPPDGWVGDTAGRVGHGR